MKGLNQLEENEKKEEELNKKEEEKKVEEKKEEEKKVEEKKEEEKKEEEKKEEEKKEEEKKEEEKPEEKLQKLISKSMGKDTPLSSSFSCEKIETTPLSSIENPTLTIDSPVKVEASSIFSKSYTTYQVKVSELNTTVRRRFSDFDWLQQILTHLFPGNIIPRLSKQNIGDRFSEDLVNKRIEDMKNFLDYILSDPLLKSSQIIYDFVSIEKESEFNTKKNIYDKMKKPNNLLNFKSLTGKENSIVNQESDNYVIKIKYASEFMIESYNSISEKIDEINERMKYISVQFKQISEIMEVISKNELTLDKNICDAYKNIDKHFSIWSDLIKSQSDYLDKFKSIFKFYRREFTSIKDFFTKVENQKINYIKAEEKLQLKKQSLFDKGDITKWEIKFDGNEDLNELKKNKEYAFSKMLTKETENVYHLKLTYGYYNNRLINQFKMIKSLICKNNLNSFNEYYNNQQKLMESFVNDINANVTFFDNIIKKGNNDES